MRRHPWLVRISLAVIGLLVVLVIGLYWLLGTTGGSSWLIAQALVRSPVPIVVGATKGTLLSGVQLRRVEVQLEQSTISARSLGIKVSPSVLINFRRVVLSELHLDGLEVVLPAEASTDTPAALSDVVIGEIQTVTLPVEIIIQDLRISDGAIRRADARLLSCERMTLRAVFSNGRVDDLSVNWLGGGIEAELTGALMIGGAMETDVSLRAQRIDRRWQGALDIEGDRERYDIRLNSLNPIPASLSGRISLPVDEPLELDVLVESTGGTLARADRNVQWRDWRGRLAGRVSRWTSTWNGAFQIDNYPEQQISATLEGDAEQLQSRGSEITSSAGGALTISGRFGVADGHYEVSIQPEEFDLGWLVDFDSALQSGEIEVFGDVLTNPSIGAQLNGLQGRVFDSALIANGRIASEGAYWIAEALAISMAENRLSADGRWSPDDGGMLNGVIVLPDLAAIRPAWRGSVEGEFEASGPLADLQGKLSLRGQNVIAGDVIADGVVVDGESDGHAVSLAAGATRLQVASTDWSNLSVTVDGSVSEHRIALSTDSAWFDALTVSLVGGLDDQSSWRGQLEQASMELRIAALNGQRVSLLNPSSLTVSSEILEVENLCLDVGAVGVACAGLRWREGEVESLTANSRELVLDSWSQSLPINVAGSIALDANLSGTVENLSGALTLEGDGIRLSKQDSDQPPLSMQRATVRAVWIDGDIEADLDALFADGMALRGRYSQPSWLSSEQPMTGSLKFEVPSLTEWASLLPGVSDTQGELTAVATFLGSREAPEVDIDLAADSLSASIDATGVQVEDGALSIAGRYPDQLRLSASAVSGGGPIRFDGQVGQRAGGVFGEGRLRAEDALLSNLSDMTLRASSDLTLNWRPNAFVMRGVTSLSDSLLVVKTLPENAVALSPDIVVAERGGDQVLDPMSFVHIDVGVELGNDVRLEGFGLKSAIAGNIDFRQFSNAAPTAFGRVSLSDAQYRAYGQTLDVTQGILDFNGPLDAPELSIRAERAIESNRVGIDITGTPSALSSTLFSDPALDDGDTLSLLITGRTLDSAGQREGAVLSDAAITLGLRQAFGLSGAIRESVGLDTLTLDGGGRDGRILAGKQLSERLYLQYAYGVFDRLSSVLLRFEINDRLALESLTGQDSAVDLIYEVGQQR